MKIYNIFCLISLVFVSSLSLVSCGDDDKALIFDYSIDIQSPDTEDKKMGDMLPIRVEFKSATDMTVHNINVKIYNKVDPTIVAYDLPQDGHVHEESGAYVYEDMIMLSHGNGFHMHGDWILEATVSGHDKVEEVMEQLEFHVHPADEIDFAYHAHIKSPLTTLQQQGADMLIEVEFESHTGQPVHHINVKIYNKAENNVIAYNQPGDSHVHVTEGSYDYSDSITLTSDAGFLVDSEWVVEAKVWGPSGAGETIEKKEFKIQ